MREPQQHDNQPARSHQPKGGMCATCAYRAGDCSNLAFEQMPVILVLDGLSIVRCTQHHRMLPIQDGGR